MESPKQSKLDSLTGLRYFAALSIVVGHVGYCLSPHFNSFRFWVQRSTGLGMPLFFVLSGFLMTYNYADHFARRRPGSLRNYAVARFARIYPLYLVTMLISFSIQATFFHDLLDQPLETLKCLACDFTLTQNWFNDVVFENTAGVRRIVNAYHGIAWSVSTEAFFYLLFPLVAVTLLPLLRRKSHAIAGALLVFGIWAWIDFKIRLTHGSFNWAEPWSSWFSYRSPYGRFGEFLIGCCAGRLFLLQSAKAPSAREARIGRGVLLFASLGFLLGAYLIPEYNPSPFVSYLHMNVGYAPFCAAIIFCLARYPSAPQRLLSTKTMILLGESSYCMYLIHPYIMSFFAGRMVGEADYDQRYIALYNIAMMFLCLTVLSLGFYWILEIPTRRWLRDRLGLRPVQPTAAQPDSLPAKIAA